MQPESETHPAPARPSSDDRLCGPLERGSSGSTADYAVDGRPDPEDRYPDTPYARPAPALPEGESHDQLAAKKAEVGDDDARLDESVEESFPASDPPSFQPRRR